MKRILLFTVVLFFYTSTASAQTSFLFYSGKEWPEYMETWRWGFSEFPEEIIDMGYTPGTPAFKWGREKLGHSTQGLFFEIVSDDTLDLSSEWSSASVYFKLRAPNGITENETLMVWLYDDRNYDWEFAAGISLTSDQYKLLNDNKWHQYEIPLSDTRWIDNGINKAYVRAVSLEAHENLINDEIYIDDVWIGNPQVRITMTLFNGRELPFGLDGKKWGFQDSDSNFVIADTGGYGDTTNVIVWENNTVGNSQGNYGNAGLFFDFNPQDFSTAIESADTLQLKIKAPANINDLVFVLWDQNGNFAASTLRDTVWNSEWKHVKIGLDGFVQSGFNPGAVTRFSIGPTGAPIPETILFDDIWISLPGEDPYIDITPPPAPTGFSITNQPDDINLITWDRIETETNEKYNIYRSFEQITNLNDPGVFPVAADLPGRHSSTVSFEHKIYYPVDSGSVSYHYAIESVDAAGNISEEFTQSPGATANSGEARAVISTVAPPGFVADGDLNEWQNIVPYIMLPEGNHLRGVIDDSLDFSAEVYAAMDNMNLYIALNITDDVFISGADSAGSWWNYDAVELFIGLYKLKTMHSTFQRGIEPDYRVIFKPAEMEFFGKDTIEHNSELYHFKSLPDSNYVIEAKIPYQRLRIEGDAGYIPVTGSTIPFEVFATDVDVPSAGAEGYLQLGYHYARNPWPDGPRVWGSGWVGMPDGYTDVEEYITVPYEFSLENNYPNPFNPSTIIRFTIANTGNVSLVIYNTLGQKVKTLVNNEMYAGKHVTVWNGTDESGRLAATGVYFYRLQAGKMMQTKKMILLK